MADRYIEIDQALVEAAALLTTEEDSMFPIILSIGKDIREQGGVPLYILDKETQKVIVVDSRKEEERLN